MGLKRLLSISTLDSRSALINPRLVWGLFCPFSCSFYWLGMSIYQFLSMVSIASKVTPLFLVLLEDWLLSVICTNGMVDVCPVFCLSIFSFIINLFAVVIASLRLFMGNRIGQSLLGRMFFINSKI